MGLLRLARREYRRCDGVKLLRRLAEWTPRSFGSVKRSGRSAQRAAKWRSEVVSHEHGLMVGARTFPGNPYDGHILSAVPEQATNLMQDLGVKLKHVVADLGFRGVDADNPNKQIIHRGKFKSLSAQQKAWLRRRQAVEPAIGHLKSDHRMDRCWLQGSLVDALHTLGCAAGYNLRWLLRSIARLGIEALFLHLLFAAASSQRDTGASCPAHGQTLVQRMRDWVAGSSAAEKTIFGGVAGAGV